MNLREAALELARRLSSTFLPDENGRRPCHGDDERFAPQPGRGPGGGPAELGDDRVLAGEVGENPGHGRCRSRGCGVGVRTSALIAGKSPVLASAAEGTGSGSNSRIRSWMSRVNAP